MLKSEFNTEAELIRGDGGVFDVVVDDDLIYSKHETGTFPSGGQIAHLLKARTAES